MWHKQSGCSIPLRKLIMMIILQTMPREWVCGTWHLEYAEEGFEWLSLCDIIILSSDSAL